MAYHPSEEEQPHEAEEQGRQNKQTDHLADDMEAAPVIHPPGVEAARHWSAEVGRKVWRGTRIRFLPFLHLRGDGRAVGHPASIAAAKSSTGHQGQQEQRHHHPNND